MVKKGIRHTYNLSDREEVESKLNVISHLVETLGLIMRTFGGAVRKPAFRVSLEMIT